MVHTIMKDSLIAQVSRNEVMSIDMGAGEHYCRPGWFEAMMNDVHVRRG